MSSTKLYEDICNRHLADVEKGYLEFDETFADGRGAPLGYVLQIAATELLPNYADLIGRFQKLEANQNYYPVSDIHITVFEFVSVRPDFKTHEKNLQVFQEVCSEVLERVAPFNIRFSGTVFTKASGILAGYDDDLLIVIREQLRKSLLRRGVAPLERYHSQSAHISFMAYRKPMRDHQSFLKLVELTKHQDFGMANVTKFELVEHDWYNRLTNKRVIKKFELETGG